MISESVGARKKTDHVMNFENAEVWERSFSGHLFTWLHSGKKLPLLLAFLF